MLEKFFHLKENHTDVKTEIMAGITTFMTMAYILAVNPNILSAAGMDSKAVLIATALASFIATALMAVLANYPFALAPGMGLNAYFAYTVVLTMGYSWQLALMAVFVEGVIFIALSLTNVREGIFNAIPMTLKSAVSVGIGLFVAFVGLQNAKLIVNSDSTLVTYQHFKGATFHSVGVGAILALLGVVITAILLVKKVKGGILYGILITWLLGIVCELTGIYVPDVEAGMYSVIPTAFVSFDFSALGETFGQVFKTDFSGVGLLNFFAVMFSFLFVDLFDTLGTLIGVASKADMLDEDGRLPHIKGALMADSIGTCVGAVLGTSTTTTFVESASGVTEGGRTGLTAVPAGSHLQPAVPHHPQLCYRSGSDHRGLLHDGLCRQDRLQRSQRGHPRLPDHSGNAHCLQHLRGYRHRHHLLDHHQCDHRQGQGEEDQPVDVCAHRAVHPQVCVPLIL